jgi:mannose/cellobiose epimerase-like protein (N-acyl-D-glucosamine 2-epimerase family)
LEEVRMRRRAFLGASTAGSVALLTSMKRGIVQESNNEPESAGKKSVLENGKLAGLTLEELKKQYQYDLFEDFLPFMDRYVVDREYGGFMCNADRDGTQISGEKNTWYEGRGIWVYSFLYNNFDRNPKYLEIARKSVDFILKHKPAGEDLWPGGYSREGQVKAAPDSRGYGDLFIAHGLAEYAKASGENKYWEMAKEIIMKIIRLYDQPDYYPNAARDYLGQEAPLFPGVRVSGVWMVLINISTSMLERKPDPEIEAIADRCLEAIMHYHYNPEFGLINELLNHDMSRPQNELSQFVYTGHAIETLWMVMYEAARRKDNKLFDLASERFRRHVEVAWDDVYGGAFRSLDHVDKNIWRVDKVLWLQEEVLVGSLFVVEYTASQWAKEMFDRMYHYIQDKFVLKKHGLPLWIFNADRKVTFEPHATRIENFHHPRHLMLNLLSLQRMIKRKGKISGLF